MRPHVVPGGIESRLIEYLSKHSLPFKWTCPSIEDSKYSISCWKSGKHISEHLQLSHCDIWLKVELYRPDPSFLQKVWLLRLFSPSFAGPCVYIVGFYWMKKWNNFFADKYLVICMTQFTTPTNTMGMWLPQVSAGTGTKPCFGESGNETNHEWRAIAYNCSEAVIYMYIGTSTKGVLVNSIVTVCL